MSYFQKIFLFFCTVIGLSSFLSVSGVQAADPKPTIHDDRYVAQYVGQDVPDPVTIAAGQTKTVHVKFKNVGSVTWSPILPNYISAYTMEERYRNSAFAGDSWISTKQTAKIQETTRPGEIAVLPVELTIPKNMPTGEYIEHFYLASESHSWVKGGYFYLKVKVTPPVEEKENSGSSAKASADEAEKKDIVRAEKVLLTQEDVQAVGGEEIRLVAIFKNAGTKTWDKTALVANRPTSLAGGSTAGLSFADQTWQSHTLIAEHNEAVAPGEFFRQMFTLRAPAKEGEYLLALQPLVDGTLLDANAEVKVTVTDDAPEHYEEPRFSSKTPVVKTEAPRLDKEPRIRVGLWKNPGTVILQAVSDSYIIFDGDIKKATLAVGDKATLTYINGVYTYKSDDIVFNTNHFIRWLPADDEHAVYRLVNYDRKVSYKGPVNFNAYRGAGEFRTTEDGNDQYVIDDLLFEDYVAGIAETSDSSPKEYIKALLTAARTYAYYVAEHTGKHDKRHFDVVAHTGDQLYLGYESEKVMTNVAAAARETRGYMVSYQNEIVITPYFGNSDGRTRSWTEVWGGSQKPWLVSVKADYDLRDGKSMFGHGVGFSQRDAAYRADEEGVSWKELLQYYYTDTAITRMYY